MDNFSYEAFSRLRRWLDDFSGDRHHAVRNGDFSEFHELISVQQHHHAWLTPPFIYHSLHLLQNYLATIENTGLQGKFSFTTDGGKTIAVIPDENLPLSGFNEFMFSVISGNSVVLKNKNRAFDLLQYITGILIGLEPALSQRIRWVDQFPASTDGWIFVANGGNASFGRYFGQRKSLIYPSQISVAVLTGKESSEELGALADDVFIFWGLSPASVRKIFVPQGYDFSPLFGAFEKYSHLYQNNRYANHYDYHRSVLLMERISFLDNGFIILQENDSVRVPPGVVHYSFYSGFSEFTGLMNSNDIFSVVSDNESIEGRIHPGMSLQSGYFQGYSSRLVSFLRSL